MLVCGFLLWRLCLAFVSGSCWPPRRCWVVFPLSQFLEKFEKDLVFVPNCLVALTSEAVGSRTFRWACLVAGSFSSLVTGLLSFSLSPWFSLVGFVSLGLCPFRPGDPAGRHVLFITLKIHFISVGPVGTSPLPSLASGVRVLLCPRSPGRRRVGSAGLLAASVPRPRPVVRPCCAVCTPRPPV